MLNFIVNVFYPRHSKDHRHTKSDPKRFLHITLVENRFKFQSLPPTSSSCGILYITRDFLLNPASPLIEIFFVHMKIWFTFYNKVCTVTHMNWCHTGSTECSCPASNIKINYFWFPISNNTTVHPLSNQTKRTYELKVKRHIEH